MAQFSSALLRCLKGGLGFYGKVVHTFSMGSIHVPKGLKRQKGSISIETLPFWLKSARRR